MNSIKKLRRSVGLTQKKFSEKYGIPLKTLQNWESPENKRESRKCPSYVLDLLTKAVDIDFPERNEKPAYLSVELSSLNLDAKREKLLRRNIDTILDSPVSDYITDIILYGSTARGTPREDSDIDLLLVLKEKIQLVPDYSRMITRLKGCISSYELSDPETDLHVSYGDVWQTSQDAYYQNVRKDGISIWKN